MAEKTEAPTARRLEQARKRGQVVRSMELSSAIGMLVAVWLLQGPGRDLAGGMGEMMKKALTSPMVDDAGLTFNWLLNMVAEYALGMALPFAEIVLGLGVLGMALTLVQTNFNWASERPFFDFGRVDPVAGIKRLFSLSGVVDLVKALLKLVIIGWAAYSYLQGNITHFGELGQQPLSAAIAQFVDLAYGLMIQIAAIYLVIGAIDYFYQRWQHFRSLRMSKQEVIEDFKQSEGDPLLRSRIRQQQRRMARERMMAAVPKADVIITNPTHLAIAINYDAAAMEAPRVLAKGSHLMAERIVAVAKENAIPVIQNIPLAQSIYKAVDIDQEIPQDFYMAMAEVLAYVYKVQGRKLQPAHR